METNLWVPKCILFKTLILFRIKCAKCVSCAWHRHLPSPSATHEANFWFSRKRRLHGSAKSRLMWPPARALFHFSLSQDACAASLMGCFFVFCFCFPFIRPKSDHFLALSLHPLIEFCSNCICQSCCIDFSKVLDAFVKINIWIALICYIDLSKLIHGFL